MSSEEEPAALILPALLLLPCIVAFAWGIIALQVKRLHDIGHHGFAIIPLLFFWIVALLSTNTNPLLSQIVLFGVIIAELYILFWPGSKGENRFGLTPIDAARAAEAAETTRVAPVAPPAPPINPTIS